MGKYKIEVTRIQTATLTFEIDADNYETAMNLAEQKAADTDYSGLGEANYESFCIEAPEDRGECPECGEKLTVEMLEGAGKTLEEGPKKCKACGWE